MSNKFLLNFTIGIFASWLLIFTSPYIQISSLFNFHKVLQNNYNLINDKENLEAYRNRQYSVERLSNYESIIDLYSNLSKNGISKDFYVYGDHPLLYLISGTKYPFIQNLYNSSPFIAQEKIIKWLISNDIKHVIIDRSQLSWDGMQNVVRTSLIYNYINFNYKHNYSYKNFVIFNKKNEINYDFKKSINIFSNEVYLGKLFNGLHESISKAECFNGSLCKPFLSLVLNDNSSSITLNIHYLGSKFIVNMTPDMGEKNYLIPIDSLWFINNSDLNFKIISSNIISYQIKYYKSIN